MKKEFGKRKKQMLLILFMLPCAGLLIWSITLIKKGTVEKAISTKGNAFNSKMPSANLPAKEKNKLEMYLEAQQDSIKKKELLSNDPYTKKLTLPDSITNFEKTGTLQNNTNSISQKPLVANAVESNEKKISDRLAKLYSIINKPAMSRLPDSSKFENRQNDYLDKDDEIKKLEQALASNNSKTTEADPEMKKYNEMLDKIISIQNVQQPPVEKNKSIQDRKDVAYTVSLNEEDSSTISNLVFNIPTKNAFFGFDSDSSNMPSNKNETTILAVVHDDQIIQDNSKIKLRLLQDIYIHGSHIAKDNFIYGRCSISNERAIIHLTTAVSENKIFPIDMTAYDASDGLEGISIPGAVTRDETKNGMSQAVQGMGIMSLDPSMAAQLTAAGIETAKSLASKKIKVVRAIAKAGHLVLLKNNENK